MMDPAEYKANYGDRITFYGGINVERLLPFGTPDEVRQRSSRWPGCWVGQQLRAARASPPCSSTCRSPTSSAISRRFRQDGRLDVIITVPRCDAEQKLSAYRAGAGIGPHGFCARTWAARDRDVYPTALPAHWA